MDKIAKNCLAILAPPPDLKVSEWADRERRLSPEASAEPGRWLTDRAPYQRAIMDSVNEPGIFHTVVVASAQVGKTEILLNVIGYFIDQDPSPMLILQPTLDMAEAFSKDRITPMIRDTPALAAKVQDAKSRDSGNTLFHKQFAGGHLTLAGSNSPSSLASRPVRIVICDEPSRYAASAGAEGDPIKLAQKRATTFYNRFFFEVSTPTIEGACRISQSFDISDKRYFFVPCPLCNEKQILKWSNFLFDREKIGEEGREIAKNVRYKCEHCEKEFDDTQKLWMLKNGDWIATSVSNGVAGFHIWEAYSPWVKWEKIANEFLEANRAGPEALKVWVNTSRGETWKEKSDAPDWQRLYERREKYQRNVVPHPGLLLVCGADVQANRIELEIVAYGRNKESWSVDYRVLDGDTTKDETWDKLTEVLYETWQHESGAQMQLHLMGIDSGYNTQHVYNWVRKHQADRVMAIKGDDGLMVMVDRPSQVDLDFRGKKIKRGVNLWKVGVSLAKSELYGFLKRTVPEDGLTFPHGFCHFPEYAPEYFKQLTSEHLEKTYVKGRAKYSWVKGAERNEALDCRVYARSCAARLGLDMFLDRHWKKLEERLGTTFVTKPGTPSSESDQTPRPKKKKPSSFWK